VQIIKICIGAYRSIFIFSYN